MLKSITLEQLRALPHSVIVDVRSPSEFADSQIPGAFNAPLLDNAQRAEIGTLYKKVGGDAALKRALEIFGEEFKARFDSVGEILGVAIGDLDFSAAVEAVKKALYVAGKDVRFRDVSSSVEIKVQAPPLVFYCWRGGARSKSTALFFHTLGFDVYYLEKGHKEFRRQVLEFLNGEKYPFKLCTLYGLTGCGKTKILQKAIEEGVPAIDLEELARHRGSAFGQIGIPVLGQQKEFENMLYWKMRQWQDAGASLVYVEGESRRIGRCQVPQRFMDAMLEGFHVKVERSLEERVALILRDYVEPVPREQWLREAQRSLESIGKRLGGEKFKELREDLFAGRDSDFVRKLLVDYYDKSYLLSRADEGFYHALMTDSKLPKF